jgi:uncharacterized membrane protein
MAGPQKTEKKSRWTLEKILPWLMIIGGMIAVAASIALSVEVFDRLKNPHFVPICNLNPVLSCTNVADSNQSHLFGFPNYFIGIAGYAAVATVGFVLLAGGRLKSWFWKAVQVGLLAAMIFITWLQFETLYRIGALCIFCMIVWTITWPIFWYTTLFNLRSKNIRLPSRFSRPAAFAQRHHADILVSWYVLIIALILKRFWYYWSSLL